MIISPIGYCPAITWSSTTRWDAGTYTKFCAPSLRRYAIPSTSPMLVRMVPTSPGGPFTVGSVVIAILPFHFGSSRSAKVFGASFSDTISVL